MMVPSTSVMVLILAAESVESVKAQAAPVAF